MAWQRFRVELAGRDPLEVQTSARDWANVTVDPNAPKAIDLTFRVVHSALVRTGAEDVPRSYDQFLDMLDGIPEDIDGNGGEDPLDPTDATPSAG
jgi:hypothetical protein